jgi:hypothetical protein
MADVYKSIGSASGRDYSTISAWEADLSNVGVYSNGDSAFGECYNDSDFNESILIDEGTALSLFVVKLYAASGERHAGTANTGTRIARSADSIILRFGSSGVTTVVSDLEMDLLGNNAPAIIQIPEEEEFFPGGGDLLRCLVHGVESTTTVKGIDVAVSGSLHGDNIYNNIIYDIKTIGSGNEGSYGVYISDYQDGAIGVINNTIIDIVNNNGSGDACGLRMRDQFQNTYKNNICMSVSGTTTGIKACFNISSGFSNADVSNNMASDSSASGHTNSLINQIVENQFISIVKGSENFKLKNRYVSAGDTGATIVLPDTEIDIIGTDRNTFGGPWDIGAFESTDTKKHVYSVGSASGRDYSTLALWATDLDDTTIYADGDSAVGECYNDSVFNESFSSFKPGTDLTTNLYSITFTAASGERHTGVHDTGVTFLHKSGSNYNITFDYQTTDEKLILVEWIDFNGAADDGVNARGNLSTAFPSGYVRNCLFHDASGVGNFGYCSAIETKFSAHVRTFKYIHNNFMYNITAGTNNVSRSARGIVLPSGGAPSPRDIRVHNNTIFRIINQSASGDGVTNCVENYDYPGVECINNIGMSVSGTNDDTTLCFLTKNLSSASGDYNLSEDDSAPGPNSVRNKIIENQFISTLRGSENLKIKSGSDVVNNGMDLGAFPSGVNVDIVGFDRDVEGIYWDIGANEGRYFDVTKSIGSASGRDYSTISAWESDLDSNIYDTGFTAIGECYADSDFSEFINLNGGGTIGLNEIKLVAASGEEHNGIENTGVRLTRTINSLLLFIGTTVKTTIEFLEMTLLNNSAAAIVYLLPATEDIDIKNCLIYNVNSTTTSHGILGQSEQAGNQNFLNNVIYGIKSINSVAQPCLGISASQVVDTHYKIFNNTVYRIVNNNGTGPAWGIYTRGNPYNHMYNNLSMNCSGTSTGTKRNFYVLNVASGANLRGNNMSQDDTADDYGGDNSLFNQSDDIQFVSTIEGSENLKLVSTNTASNNGKDPWDIATLDFIPSGIQSDITGFDRHTNNMFWDIGSNELLGSTIIKTIGSASGRDYSTINSWAADLDDSTIHEKYCHAVGELYDDSTFVESFSNFNEGVTLGINSIKLTVASGERHNGTHNTGATIQLDTSSNLFLLTFNYQLADKIFIITEWIDFDGKDNSYNSSGLVRFGVPSGHIRHCLLHDAKGGLTNAISMGIDAGQSPENSGVFKGIHNNIIYNLKSTSSFIPTVSAGVSLPSASGIFRNTQAYNNTIFRINNISPSGNDVSSFGINNFDIAGINCLNNICVGVSGTDDDQTKCFRTTTLNFASGDYNLSSDATAPGPNSLLNKSIGDQFLSTVMGSENLKLKRGADAFNAGIDLNTLIDEVNIDITGFDRNASGIDWDIGAHEYPFFIIDVIKTVGSASGRDYSSWTAWEADLDNPNVYNDGNIAIGEGYKDSIFNESVNINGGNTLGLSKIVIKAASGQAHDGTNFGAVPGVTIKAPASGSPCMNISQPSGEMHVDVEFINFDGNNLHNDYVVRFNSSGIFRNCLIHDGYNNDNLSLLKMDTSGFQCFILNNIFYNARVDDPFTSRDVFGLNITKKDFYLVYNNTVFRIYSNSPSGVGKTGGMKLRWGLPPATNYYYNNISMNSSGYNGQNPNNVRDFMFIDASPYVYASGDYNMSSDDSSQGQVIGSNLINKDITKQFMSTIEGSENFHLKGSSDAINTGLVLSRDPFDVGTYIAIDIDGNTRVSGAHGPSWDIGADELEARTKFSSLLYLMW